MTSTMMHVVWFKRDLRVVDHAPLLAAAARGRVLPLYIVEPAYWALPDTSRRQWLAIRAALEELAETLAALGAPLIVRQGEAVSVFRHLHEAHGIAGLFAHEETGNDFTFRRDRAVLAFCREAGIAVTEFPQLGVFRRLKDRNAWARRHQTQMTQPCLAPPKALIGAPEIQSDPLPGPEALHLAPDGCAMPQPGTRREGLSQLESFFTGRGAAYRRAMSSPASGASACSRLSVSLATGAISIREALQQCFAARTRLAALPASERTVPLTAIDSLVARLHWHGHFMQKLESEPALEWRAQHQLHEKLRKATPPDDPLLLAWAEGRTGLPFVDACMRSLIATGWINFRMRAMLQSVASHHLGLDWQASGTRLARLFTDYEPGIHWPQVQMQSGQTGINTPRIYNPVKQGLDQDPDGRFTRAWLPELRDVPLAFLQMPWRMDGEQQAEARCRLGQDYPLPIIDHEAASRAARARIGEIRRSHGYRNEAARVFEKHGSRKRQPARGPKRAGATKPKQLSLDL